jgi:hypothetical protein
MSEIIKLKDNFQIHIVHMESESFFAKVYRQSLANPNHLDKWCGNLYARFAKASIIEEKASHWVIEMYFLEEFSNNESLGIDIVEALLLEKLCFGAVLLTCTQQVFELPQPGTEVKSVGYVKEFDKVYLD